MALAALGKGWSKLLKTAYSELDRWILPASGGRPPGATEPGQLARSAQFLDLLAVWAARVDLTAARSAEELVDLFFADAYVLASFARSDEPAWVDVGSGPGAPGLTLAMLRPELNLTLVEPRAKRVAFMRTALSTLSNVPASVQRARSEELPGAAWDIAVSRATLPPEQWLPEGARLVRRGVWVLLAQGEPPCLEGHRIDVDCRYRWPLTDVPRRALLYRPAGEPG